MTDISTTVSRYTFRVGWSEGDGEFVATCVEFPSLSWLADTQEEALRGLRGVLEEVVADMRAMGELVPQPLSMRQYSGKFNVRVSQELHRHLAMQAAEQHVSLNHLVVRKLSAAS